MTTSELIDEVSGARLELPASQSERRSSAVAPWSVSAAELAQRLGVDPERGLSDDEVGERHARYGRNELQRHKKRSLLSIVWAQFRSLIVALLVVAAGTAFLFGETIEAWAILAVILINAVLGFVTELRAVRSMEALHKLGRVTARVRRNGSVQEISAQDLVPGDVVVLDGGDIVSADLRIAASSRLQADESTLTGESMPVAKSSDAVSVDTPLAERSSMLYKGTAVTRGSGEGVVVQIGMETELGRISALVESADEEQTPLEARLNVLGHKLIWITLGIATAVSAIGLLRGKDLFLMIETGIALAVASIPEGLPIVATIALARGVRIMAHRNALVNRLSSVETLGSAGVICTDKTGTLTENRMTVARLVAGEEDIDVEAQSLLRSDAIRPALECAVLCNNAELGDESNAGDRDVHKITRTGDPMEVALLDIGRKAGIERTVLVAEQPEEREEAFETATKMMATFHRTDSGFRVAVKGAPEEVLGVSSRWRPATGSEPLDEEARRIWLKRNERLAGDGLRVIAVAEKYVDDVGVEPYADLTFLGLIGMADPPREDVRPALEKCRVAGINVVMVTGDQPITALRVAQAVGLVDGDDVEVVRGADLKSVADLTESDRTRLLGVPVFARVTPEQKLDLIDLHQRAGQIVAMTGDGVNDAPALKKADIGIAMGLRGTQVAREASDMVLRDDAFSTIVAAVEQGRVIFANIRRFVFYLLSCNVSEVMVVGLATLLGGPLPILPLQILFLNLVTDIFPALALGMGKGDPLVMERPPRKAEEAILNRRHWRAIAAYGAMITGSVLAVLFIALKILHLELPEAVTASFLTLALAQLWHVFNMRARGSRFVRNEITTNPFVWVAVALCLGLIGSAVYVPTLAAVLQIVPPAPATWLLVVAFSFVPFGVGQAVLTYSRHQREPNEADSLRRRRA